jgi:hypothetical protein
LPAFFAAHRLYAGRDRSLSQLEAADMAVLLQPAFDKMEETMKAQFEQFQKTMRSSIHSLERLSKLAILARITRDLVQVLKLEVRRH